MYTTSLSVMRYFYTRESEIFKLIPNDCSSVKIFKIEQSRYEKYSTIRYSVEDFSTFETNVRRSAKTCCLYCKFRNHFGISMNGLKGQIY